MKALIFVIFIVLVVSVMIWTMRKSQAEADLTRRKTIKRRKKEEKEVLKCEEDAAWPTIIRSVTGGDPSAADSDLKELSMTTIEFVPTENLASEQSSSKKAGTYQ
jgi:hypothetical protein